MILIDRDDLLELFDAYLRDMEIGVFEYSVYPSITDIEFAQRIDNLVEAGEHERINCLEVCRIAEERRLRKDNQ